MEKQLTNEQEHLAAIQKGIQLKKVLEADKQYSKIDGTGKVKPEVVSSIGGVLRQAIEGRAKAFQDDEDDEHEHADLVKFIENEKVNESTLISKLNDKDIKSKEQLVTFIMNEFDFGGDDDEKQQAIIDKLETIKKKYEKGILDLSAKPVVDPAKGEISTDVVAKAQAIGQTLQKPENVAGQQTSTPPPAPPPPSNRPPGGFGK